MVKFEILDYGVYANGTHIADFDNREFSKDFAKACVEQNEAPFNVRVVDNYTGEIVYEADRRIEVNEVIEENDYDEEEEEEAE